MLSMNKQHVLVLHVAEVLGHREGGQRHAQAHARRLVHLAVDQGGLFDDPGLAHLEQEVGALTGALAHAGEDRHAVVLLGHATDHLHDQDRLADARTAEEADLATLDVGRQQVDDLDAGLEHRGVGSSWSKAGALRWISQWSSTGPMSSVSSDSPITLKT
jgi:hypothetical protein